jgi:hypothetical protein
MTTIAAVAVVVVILFVVVIGGLLALARGLPANRDCDAEGKFYSLAFRVRITRNDRSA